MGLSHGPVHCADAASSGLKGAQAGYIVHSIGSRRLIASPAAQRWARLAGAGRFHPFSRRRRLVKGAIFLMTWMGLDRLIGRHAPPDFAVAPGLPMDRWLREVCDRLDVQQVGPVLLWPPQPDRGRTYVHLLLPDGGSAGFAKVAHDAKNDREISREADVLHELTAHPLRCARTPKVLSRFTLDGHVTVVQEGFPSSAEPSPIRWTPWHNDFIEEYGGPIHRLDRSSLEEQPWWTSSKRAAARYESFAEALDHVGIDDAGLPVRRVHGDFGPANVLQSGDQRWVVDWESSAERAPVLVDPVWFAIGRRKRDIQKRPERALESLMAAFATGDERAARRDLLAALAFLLGVGYSSRVGPLAEIWPKRG